MFNINKENTDLLNEKKVQEYLSFVIPVPYRNTFILRSHIYTYACWELRQIIQNEAIPLADRDQAAEELEHLAEQGDAHAQYLMGQLYRDGPLLIPDSQKRKTGSPRRQSMVCRRHSTPLESCFSPTIGRCGIWTRASAG